MANRGLKVHRRTSYTTRETGDKDTSPTGQSDRRSARQKPCYPPITLPATLNGCYRDTGDSRRHKTARVWALKAAGFTRPELSPRQQDNCTHGTTLRHGRVSPYTLPSLRDGSDGVPPYPRPTAKARRSAPSVRRPQAFRRSLNP